MEECGFTDARNVAGYQRAHPGSRAAINSSKLSNRRLLIIQLFISAMHLVNFVCW